MRTGINNPTTPSFFTKMSIFTAAAVTVSMFLVATGIRVAASWLFSVIGATFKASEAFSWALRAKSVTGLLARSFIVMPNVIIVLAAVAILEPIANACSVMQGVASRGMEIASKKIAIAQGEDQDGIE